MSDYLKCQCLLIYSKASYSDIEIMILKKVNACDMRIQLFNHVWEKSLEEEPQNCQKYLCEY